jgi:nitric oxide reductase NorD protein
MHLPDAVDAIGAVSGLDLYRAMSAHMAAHITCSDRGLSQQSLNPAQIFFVGMLEDARVEYCAVREFPGLRGLFKSLMPHSPAGHYEHDTMYLLEKTARALLEPGVRPAIWPSTRWSNSSISTSRPMSAKRCSPGGWASNSTTCSRNAAHSQPAHPGIAEHSLSRRQPLRLVDGRLRLVGEQRIPAGTAAAGPPQCRADGIHQRGGCRNRRRRCPGSLGAVQRAFPYEDEGVSYNEMEGKEPVSDPFHYAEWDYKVQLHRPSWATVYERRQGKGDPDSIDTVLTAHKGVSHRIRQIVDRLRPQGISRQRRLEDGDELDINAAVDAIVMTRIGMQPDPRITMRNVINRRDLAVVILLDLSESTNEMVRGTEKTVLELTREASALVASAINGIGDPFAIHGFRLRWPP